MSKRNATIGAAIGFGVAALCIALALAMHAIHPYLPEIRAFIHWLLEPQLVIGMMIGMLIGAGLIVCMDIGFERSTHPRP